MRRLVCAALVLTALAAAAVALAGFGAGRQTANATDLKALTPLQQRLVSGVARQVLERPSPAAQALKPAAQKSDLTGCPVDRGANVRVNRDCLNLADPELAGRGQAQNETSIAQDPNSPSRIIGAANDYRRGDSACYTYYSRNGGRDWQDSTPPVGFTGGAAFGSARQYWEGSGDPSVAWDTKGNAYLSCLTFQRGAPATSNPDLSSAFYLYRSTGSGGASWNFPGRPIAEFNDVAGAGTGMLDKPYMTVDTSRRSRFQDRIYVTWTLFDANGTSYIFGAFSSDYGETFSSPKLVSGDNAGLCTNDHGVPTTPSHCNTNQFSQPFTGPDGALYVVWDNYNATDLNQGEEDDDGGDNLRAGAPVSIDNRGQVLLAKSTDGGNSFSAPVKVSDFYELPDCETYQAQNAGSACVLEKGGTHNSVFRAANYPSGAVNPRDGNEIDVTVATYINRHSNERNGCVPQGVNADTLQPLYRGVKTPGACNNDIVVSQSENAGASFTGGRTDVRGLPSVRDNDPRADQYFQWAAFDPSGKFATSYFDRAYGNDERTGFSDISLSGSRGGEEFGTVRVTGSSMPPPTQFPPTSFYGDYSGLSAGDVAHPLWMDTRDPDLFVCRDSAGNVIKPPSVCTASATNAAVANDENIFTQGVSIPTR